MHQPSVAIQPDSRITPAPHRAKTPIPSEKQFGCRRGFRSSKEGDSHAAAPSLWEARVPGPGSALPMLRPRASSLGHSGPWSPPHARAPSLPRAVSPSFTPVRPLRVAQAAFTQLPETTRPHSPTPRSSGSRSSAKAPPPPCQRSHKLEAGRAPGVLAAASSCPGLRGRPAPPAPVLCAPSRPEAENVSP